MSYDNTNSGALFDNDKKIKDTHPDYRGSINVEGVDYWISAWVKTAGTGNRAGQNFLSLSLTAKDENGANRTSAPKSSGGQSFLDKNRSKIEQHKKASAPVPEQDSFDDDIPF